MSTATATPAATRAPDRSLEQRRDALRLANGIRFYRSRLKRDVKVGHVDALALLREPPAELGTMKVFDLLLAMPKQGRVKVNRLLTGCRISPSKTVGGLTDRQRREIAQILATQSGRREARARA